MVTVLQPRVGFGGALGQGLGQGISSGVQSLLQQRLQEKQLQAQEQRDLRKQLLSQEAQAEQAKGNLRLMQSLGMLPADVDIEGFSGTKAFVERLPSKSATTAPLTPEEVQDQVSGLVANAMPEEEARLFVKQKPGVQQTMMRRHQDLLARGIRKIPSASDDLPTTAAAAVPVAPDQAIQPGNGAKPAEKVGKYEWTPIEPQRGLTPAEEAKFRNLNQRENNKVLVKEREKRNSLKTAEIKTNKLRQINDRGNLPSGLSTVILNADGQVRPLASLAGKVNPDTQQWVKTLNDFIGEAKTFFGGRVTNFDLESFMKRLPGLLNTDEGRRVIIEQMNLLSQLELLHADATTDALQFHGNKANLAEILGQVDQEVLEKEQAIIDRVNLVENASEKLGQMLQHPEVFGGTELFIDPETNEFHAVRKEAAEQAILAGLQRWRVYI